MLLSCPYFFSKPFFVGVVFAAATVVGAAGIAEAQIASDFSSLGHPWPIFLQSSNFGYG